MIVRILSEGQYQVPDSLAEELNRVDNRLVEVVARGDGAAYKELFAQMLDTVRKNGTPLPADELVASDVVIPPPDTTLEEAKEHFRGEGLIPG